MLGVVWQRTDLSLLIAVLLQETVEFLLCGCHSGRTYTIALLDGSLGKSLREGIRRGVQSATAEGAEGYDGLACEILLLDECCDRHRISTEPDGIAEEDDIIVSNVRFELFQGGCLTLLPFLSRALDGLLEVARIGIDALDSLDVGTELFL